MADSEDPKTNNFELNTAGLDFHSAFIDYFPDVLFSSLSLKKKISEKQALKQTKKQLNDSFRNWEAENPPIDIEKLIEPYIDQKIKAVRKGIFFNLKKMDRKTSPFSSFFPQIPTVGPGGKTPKEIEKYNTYLARKELKNQYMDELQKLYYETEPLDPRRIGVVRFFLLKEEEHWKEGFNHRVVPDLAISGDENLPLVDDYFKMIEKRRLYAKYDSDADIFKWDFSCITEHRPHNLYAEFDYYAHKAMTCRKFGSELYWLKTHPEELPLLPPDKKISLLDYFKDKGSRYAEEIHGGVLLYKTTEEQKKPLEKLKKAQVQKNRLQNFLRAVNLYEQWKNCEVPLGKLYYTLFLAVKGTENYNSEIKKMSRMKLFGINPGEDSKDPQKYFNTNDEYSETSTILGEVFIKYMLFKNFKAMDTNYFKIKSCFKRFRKHFPNSYKTTFAGIEKADEKEQTYEASFEQTYEQKINETIEGYSKDNKYLPWDFEELINNIGTQKEYLYAIGVERKFTESEKNRIEGWRKEILNVVEKLITEYKADATKNSSHKKEELEKKFTKLNTKSEPKDHHAILELEYDLVNEPEVEEKIESKSMKKSVTALHSRKSPTISFENEIKGEKGENMAKTADLEDEENFSNSKEDNGDEPSGDDPNDLVGKHNFVFNEKLEFDCPLLFKSEKIKNKFAEYANILIENRGNQSLGDDRTKVNALKFLFTEYRKIEEEYPENEVKTQIKIFFDTMLNDKTYQKRRE